LAIVWPPRFWLGPWWGILILAAAVWPATAFLPPFPAGLAPAWQTVLAQDAGIPASHFFSPQPWLTAESWATLSAGLLWLLLTTGSLLPRHLLRSLAGAYVGLAALLTGLAMAAAFWQVEALGWNSGAFGFFPNRNQMGHWLATVTILNAPLIVHSFRHQRPMEALIWLTSLTVLGCGLVWAGSRGGMAMAFFGCTAWLIGYGALRRRRHSLAFWLGGAVLAVAAAGFFIWGGTLLERVRESLEAGSVDSEALSFRLFLQRDVADLAMASPIIGTGLGNFEGIFALHRQASVSESRALHPDSDWAWLLAEGGLPALLIALALAAKVISGAFPFDSGTDREIRLAAAVAAGLFCLFGCVDVSGHRNFLPMGLVAAWALHPGALRPAPSWYPWVMRAAALAVVAAVVAAGLGAEQRRLHLAGAGAALVRRDGQAAMAHASAVLDTAPLEWRAWFARGAGTVLENGDLAQARDDFRRARMLEPSSPKTPAAEAEAWGARQPQLAAAAWAEAIRRSTIGPLDYFHRFANAARQAPELRRYVARIAATRPEFAVVWAAQTRDGIEFEDFRHQVMIQDPNLERFNPVQLTAWLKIWAARLGPAEVIAAAKKHPAWRTAASPVAAKEAANRGEYPAAFRRLREATAEPAFPPYVSMSAQEAHHLRRRSLLNPSDYAAAYALVRYDLDLRDRESALATLRRVTATSGFPAYFLVLLADAEAEAGRWEAAWKALDEYGSKAPEPR
jgi:hypothetical protein